MPESKNSPNFFSKESLFDIGSSTESSLDNESDEAFLSENIYYRILSTSLNFNKTAIETIIEETRTLKDFIKSNFEKNQAKAQNRIVSMRETSYQESDNELSSIEHIDEEFIPGEYDYLNASDDVQEEVLEKKTENIQNEKEKPQNNTENENNLEITEKKLIKKKDESEDDCERENLTKILFPCLGLCHNACSLVELIYLCYRAKFLFKFSIYKLLQKFFAPTLFN